MDYKAEQLSTVLPHFPSPSSHKMTAGLPGIVSVFGAGREKGKEQGLSPPGLYWKRKALSGRWPSVALRESGDSISDFPPG